MTVSHIGPAGSAAEPRVIIFGKPGCHLCEDALEIIRRVCDDLGVGWEERNILDDPEWERRYRDKIPVTWVDGAEHAVWHVNEPALRAALAAR